MGLDVTAYRQLRKLDVLFNADGNPVDPATREPLDNYFLVWENPDFPGRAEGLEHRCCYSFAEADNVFSRGYIGYSLWRETLAKLAGYPQDVRERFGECKASHAAAAWNGKVQAGAPFWELVNFSDCEGTIGPVVAAKLLRDFVEFDERAKAIDECLFYKGYCGMRRGLEMAADGRALQFH